MTQLKFSGHMVRDQSFRSTVAKSHEGMAHFAGTGPAGKSCEKCRFWGFPEVSYRARPSGVKPDRPCAKFRKMTGTGNSSCGKIPAITASCKYFEASE